MNKLHALKHLSGGDYVHTPKWWKDHVLYDQRYWWGEWILFWIALLVTVLVLAG
ncbi:hypothetical protein STSP2_03069 [Anaerohalosphaera lusitana]|uniref:Uncharacterized protein n=1 Tax=Anaerohalosphaera lusitana TaxID=1936003 RepID=A0A1U9NPN3_9BACT|nr:hypothetical protein [Anaerohalosphaera lusitana]AQT69869.1 hypothetical protein STSP2_03069 [Anaerohalosphaera lusitana]